MNYVKMAIALNQTYAIVMTVIQMLIVIKRVSQYVGGNVLMDSAYHQINAYVTMVINSKKDLPQSVNQFVQYHVYMESVLILMFVSATKDI